MEKMSALVVMVCDQPHLIQLVLQHSACALNMSISGLWGALACNAPRDMLRWQI